MSSADGHASLPPTRPMDLGLSDFIMTWDGNGYLLRTQNKPPPSIPDNTARSSNSICHAVPDGEHRPAALFSRSGSQGVCHPSLLNKAPQTGQGPCRILDNPSRCPIFKRSGVHRSDKTKAVAMALTEMTAFQLYILLHPLAEPCI